MSFDFSRIAELSTARGKLVELKNSAGRVIWAVKSADSGEVILEVEKITSDTYAGETTYTGEQFILLDVYPKTNGTVSVTYGGLTKTITDTSGAEEPNAQQVFFGTFNGVADSVETPASGTLTIEGDYYAFGQGAYKATSKNDGLGGCIVAVSDFGGVIDIAPSAFRYCRNFTIQELPEGITTIGNYAFAMHAVSTQGAGSSQYSLSWVTAMEGGTIILPSTIKSIGNYAFTSVKALTASSGASATEYPCYFSKVKILATTPPTLGTHSFGTRTGFGGGANFRATFEVPKGCGAVYRAADGWSAYANEIVEES